MSILQFEMYDKNQSMISNHARQRTISRSSLIGALARAGRQSLLDYLLLVQRRPEHIGMVRSLVDFLSYFITLDDTNLAYNEVFNELDPQDKAPITYHLGVGLACLVLERSNGIAWFPSVEFLLRNGAIWLQDYDRRVGWNRQKRSDFIGVDSCLSLTSIEVKGSSRKLSVSRLHDAIGQASNVTFVNTDGMRWRQIKSPIVASIFKDRNNLIKANIYDPEPEQENMKSTWVIDGSRFFPSYYRKVMSLLDYRRDSEVFSREEIVLGDLEFVVGVFNLSTNRDFPYVLKIGLLKDIVVNPDMLEVMLDGRDNMVQSDFRTFQVLIKEIKRLELHEDVPGSLWDSQSIFPDGFYISIMNRPGFTGDSVP